MKFILASGNEGKLKELKLLMPNIPWVSMKSVGFTDDISETGLSFEENAQIKADELGKVFPDAWILSDDSGLEVEALQGAPGIYSARFAGPNANDQSNNEKLLFQLKEIPQRHAQFKTVLCLRNPHGEFHFFEGILKGRISEFPSGSGGFGYDPIFIPDGKNMTLAELDLDEKNLLSHRSQAVRLLFQYIKSVM